MTLAAISTTVASRRLRIVPSNIRDVYRLAANLRAGDRDEVLALGVDPRSAIRSSVRRGVMNQTAFIDGELAAMWGLSGTLLSDVGHPWLMTTPIAERMPVQFLKVGRKVVGSMLELRSRLENVAPASYTKALRLVEALGFTIEPARPMGPAGVLFHPFHLEARRGN